MPLKRLDWWDSLDERRTGEKKFGGREQEREEVLRDKIAREREKYIDWTVERREKIQIKEEKD